jgi:glycosyltransferase involved in cell wall biosynthesis
MIGSSGVGVYLRECLVRFLESEHTFLLLGDAEKLTGIAAAYRNAEIAACKVKPFSLRELCAFPAPLKKAVNQTDLFYSPYFNIPGGITVPVYTTIHDIIFPDMPELTSKIGLMARMWFYRRAMRRSRKIFTVSEFSRSRIQHYLGSEKPVIVTYSAIQEYLLPRGEADARNGSGKNKKKRILFVGNIKRHKGLWCLMEAFFAAREEGLSHTLVIAGSRENFRSRDREILKQLERADPSLVEFTGSVSDEQLRRLFAEAALLVQPSLYEGFGLPPLEAMIAGTPALISDIPVFREIYGEFPVRFFRAGDSGDLKKKLMELLYHKPPEYMIVPEALRNKYTFRKTASKIMEEIIS